MYEVGNILWIISQEKPGVMPHRVIEEVTKKTLEGSTTQYVVEVPGRNRSRILKETDDVYTSIDSAKSELMSRAEKAIDKMLQRGNEIISEWSVVNVETSKKETLDDIQTSSKIEPADNTVGQEMVTLPDGQKVKINFKGDIP
jgi:ribosome-associated translation inhibitor RaiA